MGGVTAKAIDSVGLQGFCSYSSYLLDGGEPEKAYSLEEIRLTHPRAYKKWNSEEDHELIFNTFREYCHTYYI